MFENEKEYVVVIGSYARGSLTQNSDIDIFRLNSKTTAGRLMSFPKQNPISYIDFDTKSFNKMYQQGSLFLYSVLKDGILLYGDKTSWEILKKNFIIANNFFNEIDEYQSALNYLCNYPLYEDAYIPYLSNIFKVLKNLSIFHLANDGIYLFDKAKVLQEYYGFNKYQCALLIESNNSFERGINLSKESKCNMKKFAKEIKLKYKICKEHI